VCDNNIIEERAREGRRELSPITRASAIAAESEWWLHRTPPPPDPPPAPPTTERGVQAGGARVGNEEIEARVELFRRQLAVQRYLGALLGHKTASLRHALCEATERGLLARKEAQRLWAVNRAANQAKHRAL